VASRKEEQERRRAERLAAEQRESEAARRRLMVGYVVAGAMALAIVVGLVVVVAGGGADSGPGGSDETPENAHIQLQSGSTNDLEPDDREGTPAPAVETGDLEAAAEAANCELRLNLPDEGNTHIGSDPAKAPDYKTSPATSGDHADPGFQQADGAYSEQVDGIYYIHAMEHGRITIQYSPDLSEDEQLELKGVFDESPAAMLFFPNPEQPYPVAATAWTQLLGCKTYEGAATLDAIRAFRDVYRGQGPEDVPVVTG
jgi:Protein of unknown function (DUF3105)